MNRQETKSPAYSILVRRLAAYLVDVLLLFAAVVSTQFGLAALTGGWPFRLLTTGLRLEGWVWLSVSLPTYLYFALSETLQMIERSTRPPSSGNPGIRLNAPSSKFDTIR